MHKQMIVYSDGKPIEIVIRNYTLSDFPGMIAIQQESFPPPFPSELWWNEAQLREHVSRFPEGALCAEHNGRLIGSNHRTQVRFIAAERRHRWASVTETAISAIMTRKAIRSISWIFASTS